MAEWITDRPPTRADADEDGYVCVFTHYTLIAPGQPWCSGNATRAAQPTPPPAPVPAPAPARMVTAMTAAGPCLYVACNDGTMWSKGILGGEWYKIPSIPQPEAPNA